MSEKAEQITYSSVLQQPSSEVFGLTGNRKMEKPMTSDSRFAALIAARSASPSPPPLDYLRDELATAFFNAREHEAYYRSLRTSARPRDARRAYYATFRPVLLRLLALADDDGIVFLEHLITANIREEKRTLGAQGQGSSIERVRRVEPRGMRILGDDAGQDLERLLCRLPSCRASLPS